MSEDKPKVVILGAGVVGGSVGGWVAPHYDELYFLDQGEIAKTLRETGISVYDVADKSTLVQTDVKVIDDISEVPDVDFILLGVKNFSLKKVAEMIKEKVGDKPTIVSMANGIDNQRILPDIFSKVVYCVVGYNGIVDEPVKVGYQKKGPLVLGTPDNSLQTEMKQIAGVLNKGVETVITPHIQDAVHSKIIINLVNSLVTLTGFKIVELSEPDLFQKILSGMLYEGMSILKANGYKECKIGGMPGWFTFWIAANLPKFITKPIFQMNMKKMILPSMAQDVLLKGAKDTELESINGHILELAKKAGMQAPYNEVVYELLKKELETDKKFETVDIREVWAKIEEKL